MKSSNSIARLLTFLKKGRIYFVEFFQCFLAQFNNKLLDTQKIRRYPYIKKSKSKNPKDILGRDGEDVAAVFLKKKRYKILHRNIVFPSCEIDIIALDLTTRETVFIEVKTKRSDKFYTPLQNIDRPRIPKMIAASQEYIRWNKSDYNRLRYDFISIVWPIGEEPSIEHIIGAITPEDY